MTLIPIRCFTCGKVIANKWETFCADVRGGATVAQSLDALGLDRYCCRRMLIAQVDISPPQFECQQFTTT